jgi:hypothetical protein
MQGGFIGHNTKHITSAGGGDLHRSLGRPHFITKRHHNTSRRKEISFNPQSI